MLQSAPRWGDISLNKVAISQNLVALFTYVWRKERNFQPESEAQGTFLPEEHLSTMHLSLTRGFTPESLVMSAVIPGTVVNCLPGRGALWKVATCVPSSDWCLQLAEILYSMSVCSADRYKLKPSVFPKTLCWRCNLLSHLGATAFYCPSSKEVWEKKRQYFKGCVIRLKVEATQNQCWSYLSYKQTKISWYKKGVEQISANPSGTWDHKQRGKWCKSAQDWACQQI